MFEFLRKNKKMMITFFHRGSKTYDRTYDIRKYTAILIRNSKGKTRQQLTNLFYMNSNCRKDLRKLMIKHNASFLKPLVHPTLKLKEN